MSSGWSKKLTTSESEFTTSIDPSFFAYARRNSTGDQDATGDYSKNCGCPYHQFSVNNDIPEVTSLRLNISSIVVVFITFM